MCSPWTKHLAEFNQAERSEAPPREARPAERSEASPPLAERSEAVAPEPREGRKRKLEATELEANKHGANQHLREAGKRALHVRDTSSPLCVWNATILCQNFDNMNI